MEAINFISGWTVWLLAIIPVGAGAMVTYQAVRKSFTNDSGTIEDCNTKISNTIKGAAIGMTLSGLITLIKSYYM